MARPARSLDERYRSRARQRSRAILFALGLMLPAACSCGTPRVSGPAAVPGSTIPIRGRHHRSNRSGIWSRLVPVTIIWRWSKPASLVRSAGAECRERAPRLDDQRPLSRYVLS